MSAWLDGVAHAGTRWFDEGAEERVTWPARDAAARLLAVPSDDVVVGSSATSLLASLAWAVAPPRGSNVVTSAMAFPSTVHPWARVARFTGAELRVAGSAAGPLVPGDVERAMDGRTAVVCVSDVEHQTGQRHDLPALAARARTVGALLIVDASQSLGVLAHDPVGMGIDAIVASGYKWMCGPFGAAVMYVAPALRARLDPGVVGFRSWRNMWDLNAPAPEYPDSAARFESGSLYYGAALGLAAALEDLAGIGASRVERHATSLARHLATALRELGVEVLPGAEEPASGIVAAVLPADERRRVATALERAGIAFSVRTGRLRFSAHLYNGEDDVRRLAEAVATSRLG